MSRLGLGCTALALTLLSGACSTAPPAPERASSPRYRVGQVWSYQTRPGEEASRVVVGRIERIEGVGTVVHVKLTGLQLRGPGGVATVMSHAPVAEPQFTASVTELTDQRGDLEGFAEGYATWREAYDEGQAGVFTLPLSEIVDVIEQALDQ